LAFSPAMLGVMRASVKWLQELTGLGLTGAEIAEVFTGKGLPVAETLRIGSPLDGALVAEVVSVQNRMITVFDGRDVMEIEARTASLSDGVKIAFRPDTRRIVLESEVGLEGSEAAVRLPVQAEAGTRALETLDDEVLVVELPPNRGDLTGVIGIARELAGCLGQDFRLSRPELAAAGPDIAGRFALEVADQADTPDYIARLVTGVRVAGSPFRLKWRLLACGIRAISNIVDITNYVLFKYGQPLHGFDFQKLEGARIVTRRALAGETITTIDGQSRQLSPQVLIIADCRKPVAVAGIMGGLDTEISAGTRDVLIECARFNPVVIRRGSRALGLGTEASQRFEVGLDPEMMESASSEAAALMAELAGGQVAAGACQVRTEPAKRVLHGSWTGINQLLGLSLPAERMAEILTHLGFTISGSGDEFEARAPSFRADAETAADLAEEVGRIAGYDGIPSKPEYTTAQAGRRHIEAVRSSRVREIMAGLGFDEVQTISFLTESRARLFGDAAPVVLPQPLNERYAALRTSLLPSLLEAVGLNLRRGNLDLRLFELNCVYAARDVPSEHARLAGVLTGCREPLFWGTPSETVAFPDLSGTIETLLAALGATAWEFSPAELKGFTAGESAEARVSGRALGRLGMIDPALAEQFDIVQPVFGFELDWEALWQAIPVRAIRYELPRFPAVKRDYAFLLDAGIPAARVLAEVRAACGPVLEDVAVFDLFAGPALPSGKKSIGLRVTLRSAERTLTSGEADELTGRLVERLRQNLSAELRK